MVAGSGCGTILKDYVIRCAKEVPRLRSTQFIAGLIVVVFSATAATAAPRFDSRNMSCDEAIGALRDSGAAVVTYGPGLYKRFVATRGYCDRSDRFRPGFVPTYDDDQCPIGYLCVPRSPPGR